MNQLNQRGFTLIEVLVSVVIMTIIGAGMASLMTMMNRELTYSNSKMGKITLMHDMAAVVQNPDLCKIALGTQLLPAVSTDPSVISPMQFQLDGFAIDGNQSTDLPLYKVTLKNLFLNQITAAGKLKGLPLYSANLGFDAAEMNNGQSGSAADSKRQFQRSQVSKVFLQLASATDRTIIACYSSGSNDSLLQLVCESMHGTFNAATSSCSGTGKPCSSTGNPNGGGIFQTIDSKPRNDQSLGAVLGLGTNLTMIGGSQQWTTTLSDSDKAIIAAVRAGGQLPSGMQIGTGTQAVCLDGIWVDSGITQYNPPSSGGGGGGGEAMSNGTSSSGGSSD